MNQDFSIEKSDWDKFVAEGLLEIGPMRNYFIFLDGDQLGDLLLKHPGIPEQRGYRSAGRVRITVERIED